MQTLNLEDLAPLTLKQKEAREMLADKNAKHFLLSGGSRSGKTTIIIRQIILRCLIAPGSSHAVFREHFNHLKTSIIAQTLPDVLKLWFPYLKIKLNRSEWRLDIFLGDYTSKVWFGGLDSKERTEKILGQEHSTIYLNECSTISYASRNLALTRLAEKSGLALKMFYDCNPPKKTHWTYKIFIKKEDPETGEGFARPESYRYMRINPKDNQENLPDDYIPDVLGALPKAERDRFEFGKFGDNVKNPLWPEGSIKVIKRPDKTYEWNALKQQIARIVIGVDPSGCDENEEVSNDQIGIVVVGKLHDGTALVLDDLTGYYSPANWGKLVIETYDKWQADRVLGEWNYGGAMVRDVIKSRDTNHNVNFEKVTVSRGKHLRAEPQSAKYADGIVKHLGHFYDLEEEMSNFSTAGYTGIKSPNRVDALVMGLAALYPDQTKQVGVW